MVSNWQEDTFERLFESAPDAAIVVDADGRIVLANAHVKSCSVTHETSCGAYGDESRWRKASRERGPESRASRER